MCWMEWTASVWWMDILDNFSPVSLVCSWQKYHSFPQFQLRNWMLVNQWWLCWKSSAKVIFMPTKGLNNVSMKRAFYRFSCISYITKDSLRSQRINHDYQKSIKLLNFLLFWRIHFFRYVCLTPGPCLKFTRYASSAKELGVPDSLSCGKKLGWYGDVALKKIQGFKRSERVVISL